MSYICSSCLTIRQIVLLELCPTDRETILKEIEKQFITAKMHNCDDIYSAQRALHALIVAKALIELLEVHDCGSIGGFDGGNRGISTLEGRFEFLKNKYKIEDNLPFISW